MESSENAPASSEQGEDVVTCEVPRGGEPARSEEAPQCAICQVPVELERERLALEPCAQGRNGLLHFRVRELCVDVPRLYLP